MGLGGATSNNSQKTEARLPRRSLGEGGSIAEEALARWVMKVYTHPVRLGSLTFRTSTTWKTCDPMVRVRFLAVARGIHANYVTRAEAKRLGKGGAS